MCLCIVVVVLLRTSNKCCIVRAFSRTANSLCAFALIVFVLCEVFTFCCDFKMSENQTPPPKKAHLRKERQKAREKGQPYTTSKGKNIPGKPTPPDVASCSCKYFCNNLTHDQKQLLFMEFYKINEQNQGTYLINHMQLVPVARRRHGTYDKPEESRRSCSFTYSVPDGLGKNVQVCSKTFCQIFGVTPRKLQTLQTKKKQGCFVYKDTRGNNPHSHEHKVKFTENDRNLVRHHINSFPRYESHYSRKRTTNEFLSPDLNKNRMFLSFKAQNPTTKVNYKYYTQVFQQDFPKLKFKCLATDTCKKCDVFKVQIQAAVSENARNAIKVKQELHHRKSEKAQACMKEDIVSSQLPSSNNNCLCMDLQQVMFVPMLTHSDIFYCRQLSCYNLGIHVSNHGSAYMCMWHEGVGGRGANEISSCFFKVVTSETLLTRRRLVLWCDNCGAQNKNQFLLMAVIYLVKKGFYRSIDLKYLVSGHSYMNCDRDFGVIEKRRKTCKAMVPKDLEHVVATASPKNPFTVVSMKSEDFIDFKELAKNYLNTKNLGISKISHFRISHKNPGIVKVASVLAKEGDMVTWDKVVVLKKNTNLDDLPDVDQLPKIQFKCKISQEKRKDLEGMIEYLEKEEDKAFYRTIVHGPQQPAMEEQEEDDNQEEAEDDH